MTHLEQLWAGWRSAYISDGESLRKNGCVFCDIFLADAPDDETLIIFRDEHAAVLLNAFPYISGHVLVMPTRHVGELGELTQCESTALWQTLVRANTAITRAYSPGGMNIGFNLGEAAGAGIPQHLHAHALPRWNGDTNFMTAIANTRVLPEALSDTWHKLRKAWITTADE